MRVEGVSQCGPIQLPLSLTLTLQDFNEKRSPIARFLADRTPRNDSVECAFIGMHLGSPIVTVQQCTSPGVPTGI